MLISCEGGPAIALAVRFTPPLDVANGVYGLVDEGPPETWSYEFVEEQR